MLENMHHNLSKPLITCIGSNLLEISVNPTMSEKKIVTMSWCSGSTFSPLCSVCTTLRGKMLCSSMEAESLHPGSESTRLRRRSRLLSLARNHSFTCVEGRQPEMHTGMTGRVNQNPQRVVALSKQNNHSDMSTPTLHTDRSVHEDAQNHTNSRNQYSTRTTHTAQCSG